MTWWNYAVFDECLPNAAILLQYDTLRTLRIECVQRTDPAEVPSVSQNNQMSEKKPSLNRSTAQREREKPQKDNTLIHNPRPGRVSQSSQCSCMRRQRWIVKKKEKRKDRNDVSVDGWPLDVDHFGA